MKKRIIIYADGTWNSPANIDCEEVSPTNVFKLFEITKEGKVTEDVEQIVYYGEGVGTGLGSDKTLGGILGKGINENIIECYRFIVDHYIPGDELFLFGFSRGAYTVRSLAGLIKNCGIVKKNYYQKINRAFVIYRSKREKHKPDSDESIQFRKFFSHPEESTRIKFMGVWDTVGSLGVPFKIFNFRKNQYRFHDVKLSNIIENAYHAVSIDERRVFFRPTLWRKPAHRTGQHLEQVWFKGVHSDVGGGYHENSLEILPLEYMKERASKHGLVFEKGSSYCKCDLRLFAEGELHDSKDKIYYRIFPDYYRTVGNHDSYELSFGQQFGLFVLKLIMKKSDEAQHGETFEYLHESVVHWYDLHEEKLPINLKVIYNKLKKNGRTVGFNGQACNYSPNDCAKENSIIESSKNNI